VRRKGEGRAGYESKKKKKKTGFEDTVGAEVRTAGCRRL
jgi:hypothetical protein